MNAAQQAEPKNEDVEWEKDPLGKATEFAGKGIAALLERFPLEKYGVWYVLAALILLSQCVG